MRTKLLGIGLAIMAFVGALFFSSEVKADSCPIPVMVKVLNPEENLSDQNINLLTNKLRHIVARDGFGSYDASYLCLVATVTENNKEVISGNRPLVVMYSELHLTLANIKSGEQFGSASINLSGTGNNEAQAFQRSFSKINRHNPEINGFLNNARDKVYAYYEKTVPAISKQADLMTQRGEYEEALFLLSCVPPCVGNYEQIEESIIKIWDTYVNRECEEQLARATAIWRSQKTREAALEAAAYIGAIKRESPCASQADALLAEIEAKLDAEYARQLALEDEQRELAKEQIHEEMNLKREEINIRKMQIEAIRDIALSFPEGSINPLIDKLPSLF